MERGDAANTKRRDRPPASTEAVRKRMRATPRWDTPAEIALRECLTAFGLRYRLHRRIIPGLRRTVDVAFPGARVAVFVDGCFWHGCPSHGTLPKKTHRGWWASKIAANKRRDRDTDRKLRALGWKVVRVWEHEQPDKAARRIANLVRSRKRASRPLSGSARVSDVSRASGRRTVAPRRGRGHYENRKYSGLLR